ncbi:MAG: hypothetical protein K2Q12_00325 [Rickettsiales bacterium]|nr:hypothetical protein [Rickettsiales bacterium]
MEDVIPSRKKWMASAGNSYPIVRMALEILTRNYKELTAIAAADAEAFLNLDRRLSANPSPSQKLYLFMLIFSFLAFHFI